MTTTLLKYFKSLGARHFVALANHHDHFDNFESTHHPWNSVNVGPNRDIIGEFSKSAKAVDFIQRHVAAAAAGKPFFLYVPISSPHGPVVPAEAWQGKSGLGKHAGFVMQTDHTVVQIVKAIDNIDIWKKE